MISSQYFHKTKFTDARVVIYDPNTPITPWFSEAFSKWNLFADQNTLKKDVSVKSAGFHGIRCGLQYYYILQVIHNNTW